jgi:hypothetical protein
LGDSADSELHSFCVLHGPAIAVSGEAFLGFRSFDRWCELLVPLELGLSSPFGISLTDSGSFAEESGKISHTTGEVKKRT